MKKLRPALVFGFLGIATFASLVGTVSGTLAWYAYNARATLSYSGTSVENSVQLQIGLACAHEMPTSGSEDLEEFARIMGTEPEVCNGEYYYFAPLGYGISSSVINAYLSEFGYATNELEPITTGSYDPSISTPYDPATDDFWLFKEAPNESNRVPNTYAKHTNYLKLPFIFRASKSKTNTADYMENAEIWLTDAKGAASSNRDGNIYKAMRIFFDRVDANYTSDFIVNPDAQTAGETRVGGLLDLSDDGYYDFDENGEVIYGEYDTSVNPTDFLSAAAYGHGENPYLDINGTGNAVEHRNSFNAKHHPDTKYFEYSDLHKVNDTDPYIPVKTAKYESLSSIKPVRNNTTGELTNPEGKITSVCKTSGSAGLYVGRVDTYIWLEGWDFAVIDEEQRHSFDLGLTFEINKVSNNS